MAALNIQAKDIRSFHFDCLKKPLSHDSSIKQYNLWMHIAENHNYNTMLWDEEDQARRQDVPDRSIVENKRSIDLYNQKRNDSIEKIDDLIIITTNNFNTSNKNFTWINSETAGSIIDRMSINSLKCFHMEKQLHRTDVTSAHVKDCRKKLNLLLQQGEDLANCLDNLLKGMQDGTATYEIYRQFKMYNNPSLNPYLSVNDKPNVLIIKHGSLGDWIVATGTFKLIRNNFPDANLIILTSSPYAKLAKMTGWFDEIWVDDRKSWMNIPYNSKIILKLISQKYQFIYDLQCSNRVKTYFKLARMHRFNWSGKFKGCSHPFMDTQQENKVEYFHKQLSKTGIQELPIPDVTWLKGPIDPQIKQEKYALFIPSCSVKHQKNKAWSAKNYSVVIDWLAQRNIKSVLTGTESDKHLVEQIIDHSSSKNHIINLVNKSPLDTLAELSRYAQFAIGSDTGPTHIVAATKCKTIVLISSSLRYSPEVVKPYGNHVTALTATKLSDISPLTVTEHLAI